MNIRIEPEPFYINAFRKEGLKGIQATIGATDVH